jgi:hypothetical protein
VVGIAAGGTARRDSSDAPPRPPGMRFVFSLYLALIAAGLAFYIVVGLTHH